MHLTFTDWTFAPEARLLARSVQRSAGCLPLVAVVARIHHHVFIQELLAYVDGIRHVPRHSTRYPYGEKYSGGEDDDDIEYDDGTNILVNNSYIFAGRIAT